MFTRSTKLAKFVKAKKISQIIDINNIFSTGPVLIILAALLWGLDGVLRRSLFVLVPIMIVFYEHLIGLILLLPSLFAGIKKEVLTKKEWLAILWVSLMSGLLGTLWFTTALMKVQFIPFSVVFLLQKLQPIFAASAGVILLKEKITPKYLLWAGVAFIAAYFVTFKNGIINFTTGAGTISAALFALAAAFAWGSSTAVSRYSLLKHSPTLVTGLRFFFTTIFALGAIFVLGQTENLLSLTFNQLSRLLFIALSTGMFALWLYYKGLKKTPVKNSTILELVFPLTAVFIDIFLYKTVLAPSQYFAAAILLWAVVKISEESLSHSKKPTRAEYV